MTANLDAATDAATTAAAGTAVDGFLERIAERVGGKASVKAVFGDPVERDGITVIPVAKVRWGFGGGSGSATEVGGGAGAGEGDSETSAGSGGGGGATADPIGWIEIGPDGAEFRQITPSMPGPGFLIAAGLTAAMVLRGLARLLRG